MKRALAWIARLPERANPIVVKEFRQAVQSRMVIAVLLGFLLVNLLVMSIVLVNRIDRENVGPDVFFAVVIVLFLTCMVFVPLYSAVRLSLERSDTNIDLLFITTITPGAIVRGKYFTAMALTLLLYSACLPFITLAYMLRGVDVPTIWLLLLVGFGFSAAVNAVAVLAGSLGGPLFLRCLVGLALLVFLYGMIFGLMELVSEAKRGYGFVPPRFDLQIWATLGTVALIEIGLIGLVHVLSVAVLSPKSANRMLVPRLYVMGIWIVTGAILIAWTFVEKTPIPTTIWVVGSGVALIVLLLIAAAERDSWSIRVRRSIPRNPALRAVAFVLYTGSAGGTIWCSLMMAATLLAGVAVGAGLGSASVSYLRPEELFTLCTNMAMIYGYFLCYCLTAAFLRWTLLKRIPTAAMPLIALLIGTGVCIVPLLLDFLFGGNTYRSSEWALVGTPMVLDPSTSSGPRAMAPVLVILWLLLGGAMALPWMGMQMQNFTPYRPSHPPARPEPVMAEAVDEPAAPPIGTGAA